MRRKHKSLAATRLLAETAFLICLASSLAAGQSITIGPYIQNPGTTAMTVQYITDTSSDGMVRYGDGKALDRRVVA